MDQVFVMSFSKLLTLSEQIIHVCLSIHAKPVFCLTRKQCRCENKHQPPNPAQACQGQTDPEPIYPPRPKSNDKDGDGSNVNWSEEDLFWLLKMNWSLAMVGKTTQINMIPFFFSLVKTMEVIVPSWMSATRTPWWSGEITGAVRHSGSLTNLISITKGHSIS